MNRKSKIRDALLVGIATVILVKVNF